MFSDCNDSEQTRCVSCSRGEYQPSWTEKRRCLQQKFCDPGQYLQPEQGFHNPEKPLKAFAPYTLKTQMFKYEIFVSEYFANSCLLTLENKNQTLFHMKLSSRTIP